MDIPALANEITVDPLARGYAGMTDQQVADSLNTSDRTRNRTSLSGDEMFSATDSTEWGTLTDAQRQNWLAFTGKAVDPFASANVAFVQWLFGGGSATISNLNAIRTDSITRADEIGILGSSLAVGPAHVAAARAL